MPIAEYVSLYVHICEAPPDTIVGSASLVVLGALYLLTPLRCRLLLRYQ